MNIDIPAIVGVAFPIACPGLYDYTVPERLHGRVMPGMPVLVDLKNRSIWGVAVQLKAKSAYPNLKEVQDIAPGRWTEGDRSLIRLYEWIASYYQTELSALFKPFIKTAFDDDTGEKNDCVSCCIGSAGGFGFAAYSRATRRL